MQETVELDMEELNELFFKVKVEGADPAPAKVRLVCETGDVAFMFTGRLTDEQDVVQFVVPSMKNRLKEGTYASRVEVLVDNRYFAPVKFNINFKKVVSVVAEAVSVPTARKVAPTISVTASPIVIKKLAPVVESVPVSSKPSTQQPTPTLRERFKSRVDESVIDVEEADEDLIREIVLGLTKRSQPKRSK